jgi:ribosomal protein L7Ae-like RNA K-turn-binding protein
MPANKKQEKAPVSLPEARRALFSALSLCRKAGKLSMGYDACIDAVVAGKAAHIFAASDASESTVSRVQFETQGLAKVKRMPLTQQELLELSRKPVAVYAVKDANLARLCEMKCKQCEDLIAKEEVSE